MQVTPAVGLLVVKASGRQSPVCRSQPVAAVHSPAQHQVCQGLASTPALTPDSPVLARAGTNGAQPKCAVAFLFTPFQPLP